MLLAILHAALALLQPPTPALLVSVDFTSTEASVRPATLIVLLAPVPRLSTA